MVKRGSAESRKSQHPRQTNLLDLAYDRLEEQIITCELRPGLLLSLQDLQDRIKLGRTPTHQAVNRLATDTLVLVRPRHGLQIAPVDLARCRTLAKLREDIERFVAKLAAERCQASDRNEMLHLAGILRDRGSVLTIDDFNRLDRRINQLITTAADEPFLENTLRPLHSMFRRTGWIYHNWVRPEEGLSRTIECHLALLDAIAEKHVAQATNAARDLAQFSASMLEVLGRGTDPSLFDCNIEALSMG
jgi:DNA-binding GntR family transcriptional regulator